MNNLQQLENTIEELERQSNELREFNSVYSEIANLKQDISDNLKLLKENNEGLAEISAKIKGGLTESQEKIDELLQANNEGLDKISAEIKGGLTESQKKIDEIYKDNKAFQKELDSSIFSRLDKHKSDIQVEIRNEGTQIQRAFENTLNSNFNALESKLKYEFSEQTKKINTLKILLYVLTAINIGLAIGLFIK